MPKKEDKRTPIEIEDHKRQIADLYLKRYSQAEIAKRLGVHQSTVSRDLDAIKKVWQEKTITDMDTLKQRELEEIDLIQREAWQAWLRSQQDGEIATQRQRGGAIEVSLQKSKQYGDPRFLAQIERCIERRCKILGIEAPAKLEINWQQELESQGIDASELFNRLVEYIATSDS